MTADPRDLPLVIAAGTDDPRRLRRAATALAGVARVAPLPEAGEARDALLHEAQVVLAFTWPLSPEASAQLTNLRFVQGVFAGADHLPLKGLAAQHPNLQAASGPGMNAVQVAEFALGLYLDCAKRITWRDRELRAANFAQHVPGQQIAGARIAVLGHGRIGTRVADLLDAMGAKVDVVTRRGGPTGARTSITMEACRNQLGRMDGMVVALPLTATTTGLIDATWLSAMKSDAVLVNVARGKIIDQAALFAHLQANPEFQAGLDVWWRYPGPDRGPEQEYPFGRLDNVVMTPHAAFNVPGQDEEMIDAAGRNIKRFLTGEIPDALVDFDECVR